MMSLLEREKETRYIKARGKCLINYEGGNVIVFPSETILDFVKKKIAECSVESGHQSFQIK